MRKKTDYLIVVSGSVGTGKTCISKQVARRLGYKHIEVGKVVTENKKALSIGADKDRKTIVADISKTKKFLKKRGFLGGGNVLEGHYAHFLSEKRPDFLFVLRCDPKVLDRRLEKRGYSEKKRAENILAEILDVCFLESEELFGEGFPIEIDTSRFSKKRSADEIVGIVTGKKTRPPRKPNGYAEKYLGKRNSIPEKVSRLF